MAGEQRLSDHEVAAYAEHGDGVSVRALAREVQAHRARAAETDARWKQEKWDMEKERGEVNAALKAEMAALAESRASAAEMREALLAAVKTLKDDLAESRAEAERLRSLLLECADPLAYMERHHHYKLTEQERTLPERIAAALASPAAEAEKERSRGK